MIRMRDEFIKTLQEIPHKGIKCSSEVMNEEIWAMVANFSQMAATVDPVACYQQALL